MKTVLLAVTFCFSAQLAFAADEKPTPAKPKRDPAELFKIFDRDADGGISLDEYRAGMVGKMDPARVAETFSKKDLSADGKLNLEELVYTPPKAPPAPKAKEEKKAE